MDSMWSIMDVIFVGAGLYMLYAWYLMKTKGEIKTALLMNKDVQLKKCKDLEGYKKFISPKMLIFGIACTLYGAFGLVNTYVMPLPKAVYLGIMAVFLVALVWFAAMSKKGIQNFW